MESPNEQEQPPRYDSPDFWSMYGRKILGKSEDWVWLSVECLDDPAGPNRHTLVKGAAPDGVRFKSGKRKGEINWKFRHDEAQFVVSDRELDAFKEEWERETGTCRCGGHGKELERYSSSEGPTYRTHGRCGGTGKAPSAAARGAA